MARHAPLIPLAALLCAFAAGCGSDDSESAARAKPASAAAAAAVPPNLERFLLQNDEIPGFDRVESPRVDSSVESFAGPTGGADRLRKTGFVSATFQPIVGAKGNGGFTNVVLFKSEAGAREWMAFESSDKAVARQLPGAKVKRFSVSAIPGAHGYTARDQHKNRFGHIYWTQGRCMMIIGDEGKGPFVEPLMTGAKAIYERTGGKCPE